MKNIETFMHEQTIINLPYVNSGTHNLLEFLRFLSYLGHKREVIVHGVPSGDHGDWD